MRKRKLVALLLSDATLSLMLCVILMVRWVGLHCVIMVFPDHINLLFPANKDNARYKCCHVPIKMTHVTNLEKHLVVLPMLIYAFQFSCYIIMVAYKYKMVQCQPRCDSRSCITCDKI